MSPLEVAQRANEWADAIGAIILHVLPIVLSVVIGWQGMLLKLHGRRLDTHSSDIKAVMLQTPPPTSQPAKPDD